MQTFIQRLRDERGEGVISTGIAILIMAVVGGAMFVAINRMMGDAAQKAETSVNNMEAEGY